MRTFGKSLVLIEKSFDPLELFSPHPQLMTVDLNRNGSLKLDLIATWKYNLLLISLYREIIYEFILQSIRQFDEFIVKKRQPLVVSTESKCANFVEDKFSTEPSEHWLHDFRSCQSKKGYFKYSVLDW